MRLVAVFMIVLLATPLGAQSSKQVFGPNPNLPFSAAVKADGLIYVSGMINAEAKSDVKAQTKATLDAIAATLKTAGSSLTNAASMTVYCATQRILPPRTRCTRRTSRKILRLARRSSSVSRWRTLTASWRYRRSPCRAAASAS